MYIINLSYCDILFEIKQKNHDQKFVLKTWNLEVFDQKVSSFDIIIKDIF